MGKSDTAVSQMLKISRKAPFDTEPIYALMDRVIYPGFHRFFTVEPAEDRGEPENYAVWWEEGAVRIRASSASAACNGFYAYCKTCLNCEIGPLTRHVPVQPGDRPPAFDGVMEQRSLFPFRYFLNYCTYGYTMAFWQWEDYERLIDWMALSGVNLALSIVGHEEVVRRLLREYGCGDGEIGGYIAGAAYLPWQWMNNLTGFGGPADPSWFERRLALGRRINERLRQLGIDILYPGFSGSVPESFQKHHPEMETVSQGVWCASFARPHLVKNLDERFYRMAADYYRIQREVWGETPRFLSVDPFHEGGDDSCIDRPAYAQALMKTMLDMNPEAVWVLQGWTINPRRDMLCRLPPEHVLITDLVADIVSNWEEGDDFLHYPYIMCQVNNYGGQRNWRGHFLRSLTRPYRAAREESTPGMCGIGLMMEGIEDGEIFYDLMGDMAFGDQPEVDAWIREYAGRRYGSARESLVEALRILTQKVLCCTQLDGTRESVFLARPSLDTRRVSSWTSDRCAYDNDDLLRACRAMWSAAPACGDNPCYRFDLIDLLRQAHANLGWEVYGAIQEDYREKRLESLRRKTGLFLDMLRLQDRLMSIQERTTLGRWIGSARDLAVNDTERDRLEGEARRLLTVWGDESNAVPLHDYAAKEWGGMLGTFYYDRWSRFFRTLTDSVERDRPPEDIDWYAVETAFVDSRELPAGETPGFMETAGRMMDHLLYLKEGLWR